MLEDCRIPPEFVAELENICCISLPYLQAIENQSVKSADELLLKIYMYVSNVAIEREREKPWSRREANVKVGS